ncbi:MAG: hypothetical protein Q8O52_11045 [Sulfuritalea sp.]|nr:hypothetical protein [Sulfuritalea sp.]
MEKTIAHLGFIQGIVTRMGTNSFLLKGWSVTLVAAMFALAVKDADKRFMLMSYFSVFIFWALDGFFLHQEICSENYTRRSLPDKCRAMFSRLIPSQFVTTFRQCYL